MQGKRTAHFNPFLPLVTGGNDKKSTSNKIGKLSDDFFSEFMEIKVLSVDGTHISVWPIFTSAQDLVSFSGFNVRLISAIAPANLGNKSIS